MKKEPEAEEAKYKDYASSKTCSDACYMNGGGYYNRYILVTVIAKESY